MRSALILVSFVLALAELPGAEVLVKQVTIAVPTLPKVRFRVCSFYVSEEVAARLPRFSPETPGDYLLPAKALAIAFDVHFLRRGVPRARYYREAQVSLEKVDDYTESSVARAIRNSSAACQNLWFYVVRYGYEKVGGTALGPPPVLVLMDGTIILPREEIQTPP